MTVATVAELEARCLEMGWRIEMTFEGRIRHKEKPWAARLMRCKHGGWSVRNEYSRQGSANAWLGIPPPSRHWNDPILEAWGNTYMTALYNLIEKFNGIWGTP